MAGKACTKLGSFRWIDGYFVQEVERFGVLSDGMQQRNNSFILFERAHHSAGEAESTAMLRGGAANAVVNSVRAGVRLNGNKISIC